MSLQKIAEIKGHIEKLQLGIAAARPGSREREIAQTNLERAEKMLEKLEAEIGSKKNLPAQEEVPQEPQNPQEQQKQGTPQPIQPTPPEQPEPRPVNPVNLPKEEGRQNQVPVPTSPIRNPIRNPTANTIENTTENTGDTAEDTEDFENVGRVEGLSFGEVKARMRLYFLRVRASRPWQERRMKALFETRQFKNTVKFMKEYEVLAEKEIDFEALATIYPNTGEATKEDMRNLFAILFEELHR